MNDSKIPVRYSNALFLSAKEKNRLDVIHNDLKLVAETLGVNKDAKGFIENPLVKPSSKLNFLIQLFSKHVDELTISLFRIVNKNRRESFLFAIIRHFKKLYFEFKGLKKAVLTTAIEIGDIASKKVQKLLEQHLNSEIELSNKIDKEIIGGFVLRVDDSQVNASVKSKLRKVLQEIS